MCQIIHKPKNFTLPFDLLESTCMTNSDGFGLMMYSDGKIIADKAHDGDNDPEAIMRILEGLHDDELFMHFRYRTKGELGTENCHPFKIYDANDREIYLMHNGTISGYGSDKQVDSEAFGLEFVAPLYDRFLKSGDRSPLKNDFFKNIVTKFAGSTNRVVLLDNTGDHAIINETTGYMYTPLNSETEFWVANTYSFNKTYRTPTPTTYYRHDGTKGGGSNGKAPFFPPLLGNSVETVNSSVKSGEPQNVLGTTSEKTEKKEIGKVPVQTERLTYSQHILNLNSVDELLDMTFEDISDLVDIEPENAKLLITELLYELYTLSDERWEDGTEVQDIKEEIEEVVVN